MNAKYHPVGSVELLLVILAACLWAGCHSPDGAARSEKDLERLRAKSDQGSVEAQFQLGQVYATGDGVPRNDEEALKWFQLAANQGHVEAQYHFGLMLKDGRGTEKNFVEAYKWLNLAAAHGNANAEVRMDTLGRMMSREQIAEAQRAAINFTAEQSVANPAKKPDRETREEPVFSPVTPAAAKAVVTPKFKEEPVFSQVPPSIETNQPAAEPVKKPKRKAKKEPVFSPLPPPSGK